MELLDEIPDGVVDLVLTDPPYGTTRAKWDSVLPIDAMWEQINRVLVTNGTTILFGNEPFSSGVRVSNMENYKYDIKWVKNRTTGFPNCNYRPMRVD